MTQDQSEHRILHKAVTNWSSLTFGLCRHIRLIYYCHLDLGFWPTLPLDVVFFKAKHVVALVPSVRVEDVRPRPDIPLAPIEGERQVIGGRQMVNFDYFVITDTYEE